MVCIFKQRVTQMLEQVLKIRLQWQKNSSYKTDVRIGTVQKPFFFRV